MEIKLPPAELFLAQGGRIVGPPSGPIPMVLEKGCRWTMKNGEWIEMSEEQDKELMQYAEKLARNPTTPIDNEIQKLLENKYDERY